MRSEEQSQLHRLKALEETYCGQAAHNIAQHRKLRRGLRKVPNKSESKNASLLKRQAYSKMTKRTENLQQLLLHIAHPILKDLLTKLCLTRNPKKTLICTMKLMDQLKANICWQRPSKTDCLTFLHVQLNMIARLHLPRPKNNSHFLSDSRFV